MNVSLLNFSDSLFKFKVSEEIKKKLRYEDYIALTEIGLPSRILSNSFVYNEFVIDDNNHSIILGHNTHVKEWKLKISLVDSSIFYSGRGNYTDDVFSFYNSSIYALLLSLLCYDFFIQKLITKEAFGEYHTNHEKYANMLFELISDIDKTAVEKGVWFSLIDEMKLGVI
jgi:hypothetical protein